MQSCLHHGRWSLPFWLQSFQWKWHLVICIHTHFFVHLSMKMVMEWQTRSVLGTQNPWLDEKCVHWFPLVFWSSCLRNMTFSLFSVCWWDNTDFFWGSTRMVATTMRDQGLAVLGCLWFGGGLHKLFLSTMHYWCWANKQSLKSLGWVQETLETEEWMICSLVNEHFVVHRHPG